MLRSSIGLADGWRVLLQAFVISSVATAQVVSGPLLGQAATATYALSGSVVNSVTGEPIRRALVVSSSAGEHLALTDANGRFEFDGLPAGEIDVRVHKPGFFGQEELGHGAGPSVVAIGPGTPSLDLKLVPQSVIYGHVKNQEGEPIEMVPVKAISSRIVEGRKRWQVVGAGSTNEDGEFRIANLTAGSYYIEAEPGDYARHAADSDDDVGRADIRDEGYAAAFYPGASDMSSATPFEIGAGQEADIELSLRPLIIYKVSGRVVGLPPNSGIQMMFTDRSGNQFSSLKAFNPAMGNFEAEVPAGRYTLQVLAWMPEGKQLRAESSVNVTGDTPGLSLALATVEPTPINLRLERSKPSVRGHESLTQGTSLVQLQFVPAEEEFEGRELWSIWQMNPRPMLVLPDLPAGRYSVEVHATGDWYVQSAQCGSTDLLHEQLIVTPGMQVPLVDVVLRDDSARLSGHVNTGQSQTAAAVLVMPEQGPANRTVVINTGPNGNFFVANLAPGNYTVLALDSADGLEYGNPDAMDAYASQAAHVMLEPNGQSEITVELTHITN
ncbi:MAG TPA: carboxypeptidase-like regulatory domain-containing protein [Terriglobales bacterium]|nr:carboxypeptidase-like regulatory domain-containing protein [Terriglobales bacterium]